MEKASETEAREEHQAVVRRVEALERALAPRPWSNRDRAILAGGLAGIDLRTRLLRDPGMGTGRARSPARIRGADPASVGGPGSVGGG